nr:putative wax ester synthase/acyl-CoA:diacylglycerol acyltransferase [uncultured bacterium]WHV03912.1 putative wax ester synthase/acyl-CoA:diacylglycerol acyltransferase [uncultured bacterium]WHW29843.1 Wax ester synthase/acyl-CoA:diacylglycerol acyltransferase [uncultured bacterium]WHW29849.1 wax ester/triacylglycerol synthase family O-acyltransferase [uncultured bacterium]
MSKKVIKDILDDALDNSIEQISAQDATFLYAESPTSPMHIGSLTIVEGSLNFNDFKAILASKLHLMPKFRKRLLNVPFNLDYPYWVDDPNFDIDLHLERIKLPDPANWKTLRETTASIFSGSLNLRRPLWSVSFIEGLDEISQIPKGSVAIVIKIHHVMIDGASGVGLMGMLFDREKEDRRKSIPLPKPFEPDPLPDDLSLLLKSSSKFIKDPFKAPVTLGKTALALIKSQASKKFKGKKTFNKRSFSVPRSIFNNNVSPKRTWGTAILSFDRINTLRKIMGVSINDLILAMCSGALRQYLLEIDKLPSQSLVANVPISIRVQGQTKKMENKISNMLIQIATHIKDPIERLEYIQEQTEIGKSRHKAVGAKSLMQMAESVPFGLANLAAELYGRYDLKELVRPPFNLTITNVPGPSGMLYLQGHKIVTTFGLTPVLDGFGLIIAAFSYNGQVTITTTSDAHTMPDADKFSRYIRESANELEKMIQQKGKKKETEKKVKIESVIFFNSLRKYIKANPKKVNKKNYGFNIILNDGTNATWQLNKSLLKKQKLSKPTTILKIKDEILVALYNKKVLLEELQIQGRFQVEGSQTQQKIMINLLTDFLKRN